MAKNIVKKHYSIKSINGQKKLYEGQFKNFKQCIENAVKNGVSLPYADLRNKNLQNANLDDANLEHADFTSSNLSGANLSEANLKKTIFDCADLYNTCLAYTNLEASSFLHANFGATDITQANIAFARFNNFSCFSLDFRLTKDMRGCLYLDEEQTPHPLNQAPLVILGHPQDCAILDTHIILKGQSSQPNKAHNIKRLKREIASSIIDFKTNSLDCLNIYQNAALS